MGLFNSGVGKRSRRYSQWMTQNNQAAFDQINKTIDTGAGKAGDYLTNAYKGGQKDLSTAYTGSRDTLTSGQSRADQLLSLGLDQSLARSDQGFGQARTDLTQGRDAALANLTGPGGAADVTREGYAGALQSLRQLYGQGAQQLQGAADAWSPLVDQAQAGYTMYQNALGLNGQGGNTAATDAFHAGPGYQWQVDQASSAAQRAANRTGSGSGGNAMDAVTRLSSHLADQEYGNWVQNLSGFQGAAQTATAGRAGALTSLGQLYATQGNQEATLQQGQGRDLATIMDRAGTVNQTAGQNLAANSTAQGTAAAGLITNAGTARATNATNYAQMLANLQTMYGQNKTSLGGSYGSAMAGLETGVAGAKASAINNLYNSNNQALGVALQGSNQQGAETASWGQSLIGMAGQVLGLGVSGGGTLGGNFLSSLFK